MREKRYERQRREREPRKQMPRLWAFCGIRRQREQRGRRWRREGVGSIWGKSHLVRLLSRTQRHMRRGARRKCQLVRRSARVQSERARRKKKGHTLMSASVQRALAMGSALRKCEALRLCERDAGIGWRSGRRERLGGVAGCSVSKRCIIDVSAVDCAANCAVTCPENCANICRSTSPACSARSLERDE